MADYTSLSNVKALLNPLGLATNAADDTAISQMISAVSAWFDTTGRVFVSASATRYYDVPEGPELYVDEYTTLTSITNGDGTSIALTDVIQMPANKTPKYCIRIKGTAPAYWVGNGYDTIQAIAVVAAWGYSAAAPSDVRSAVEGCVVNMYQARRGQGSEGVAQVTAAGLVITPKDITPFAQSVYRKYTRTT
jgi:hypothetical protein